MVRAAIVSASIARCKDVPAKAAPADHDSITTSSSLSLTALVVLCALPSFLSMVLSLAAEVLQANASERMMQYVYLLAAAAFILNVIAVPATHELSGKRVYPTIWRFYQPWRGGALFVALQFVSWMLFTAAIVHVLAWVYAYVAQLDVRRGLLASSGIVSFGSEVFMLLSITSFNPDSAPLPAAVASVLAPVRRRLVFLRRTLVLALFCNMPFFLLSWIVLPGILLTFPASLVFYVVTFGGYIFLTYRNAPTFTGVRRWEWFRRSWIIRDVIAYFKGDIVKEGDLEPDRRYIFAFAPHGVMTLTAVWALLHPKFERFFPGQDVIPLGASILQHVPLIRDGPQWVGTRSVSRHSFINALNSGHSVLMVPGGIKEMRLSRSWESTIRLYARHKGFVRLAIEQGADLVPTFSFGETRYFDHVDVPGLSDLLLRWLGCPLPYFVGVANFLQLPRRQKVTVVFGKPIRVEKCEKPTDEQVDALHRAFYEEVRALFERHKATYHHQDYTMELVGLEHLKKE